VNSQTFYGLGNLETLNLSFNLLESLIGSVFTHLPKLKKLDLCSNTITSVAETAFVGLDALEALKLSKNNLLDIPVVAFGFLSGLDSLDISGNRISRLEEDSFSNFVNLIELDLSENNIKFLSDKTFHGLLQTRRLQLNSCNLSSVPSAALAYLPMLENIQLNQNNFLEIPSNAFPGLVKLRSIQISHCPLLKVIYSGAFLDNVELSDISISNNGLLSLIEDKVFHLLDNVKILKIENNLLQKVNLTATSMSDLQELLTHGNPWRCDCSIHPLQMLLQSLAQEQEGSVPVCSSPLSVQGQSLLKLDLSDCHIKQAAAVVAGNSRGISMLVVIIGVSTVLVISGVGTLVFFCRGGHSKPLRVAEGTNSSLKEAGHGRVIQYQRTMGYQDIDWLLIVRGHGDYAEGVQVPVTEL